MKSSQYCCELNEIIIIIIRVKYDFKEILTFHIAGLIFKGSATEN